ncbi:hypothetical protein [Nesterenkonia sphaerica]|nr:hypothetical protein [Nesterenkonia sphaerica]
MAATLAGALAGCGETEDDAPAQPATEAAETTASPVAETSSPAPEATTASASPASVSPAEDLSISCREMDTEETEPSDLGSYESFEAAWEGFDARDDVRCEASYNSSFGSYDLTETEREALETANYDKEESLRVLYGICATPLLGDNSTRSGGLPWSEGQQEEVQGALVLCPDHPDRGEVEERIAEVNEAREPQEPDGSFGSGSYRVGEDMPPGFYVTESESGFDGCYWERLDAAGNIVENNLMRSGFRAEVDIAETDHSFFTDRCGTWEKQ